MGQLTSSTLLCERLGISAPLGPKKSRKCSTSSIAERGLSPSRRCRDDPRKKFYRKRDVLALHRYRFCRSQHPRLLRLWRLAIRKIDRVLRQMPFVQLSANRKPKVHEPWRYINSFVNARPLAGA